jgi:hypothetical protein
VSLGRAYRARADGPALWPSEHGRRVGLRRLDSRFAVYRDDLGLDPVLDFHSLRRSYITRLIEDGWVALLVQSQAGHDQRRRGQLPVAAAGFRAATPAGGGLRPLREPATADVDAGAHGGLGDAEAAAYVKQLAADKRYVRDVY